MLESKNSPGAVLLGARAIQEGGAFLEMTREEVELFCIDNQVMVEVTATEEALIFDFQSVTTAPGVSTPMMAAAHGHLHSATQLDNRDRGSDNVVDSYDSRGGSGGGGSSNSQTAASAVTGIEAVMQVAHIILTDFKYEEDAFERAKQSFHEQFDSTVKGLETACTESLTYSLTGADPR